MMSSEFQFAILIDKVETITIEWFHLQIIWLYLVLVAAKYWRIFGIVNEHSLMAGDVSETFPTIDQIHGRSIMLAIIYEFSI